MDKGYYNITINDQSKFEFNAEQINDFDFIDHRHDQSIFSILRKIDG